MQPPLPLSRSSREFGDSDASVKSGCADSASRKRSTVFAQGEEESAGVDLQKSRSTGSKRDTHTPKVGLRLSGDFRPETRRTVKALQRLRETVHKAEAMELPGVLSDYSHDRNEVEKLISGWQDDESVESSLEGSVQSESTFQDIITSVGSAAAILLLGLPMAVPQLNERFPNLINSIYRDSDAMEEEIRLKLSRSTASMKPKALERRTTSPASLTTGRIHSKILTNEDASDDSSKSSDEEWMDEKEDIPRNGSRLSGRSRSVPSADKTVRFDRESSWSSVPTYLGMSTRRNRTKNKREDEQHKMLKNAEKELNANQKGLSVIEAPPLAEIILGDDGSVGALGMRSFDKSDCSVHTLTSLKEESDEQMEEKPPSIKEKNRDEYKQKAPENKEVEAQKSDQRDDHEETFAEVDNKDDGADEESDLPTVKPQSMVRGRTMSPSSSRTPGRTFVFRRSVSSPLWQSLAPIKELPSFGTNSLEESAASGDHWND